MKRLGYMIMVVGILADFFTYDRPPFAMAGLCLSLGFTFYEDYKRLNRSVQ